MYTIKTKIVLRADSKTFEWESIDKWNIMIEEALEGWRYSNDCSSHFFYIALRAAAPYQSLRINSTVSIVDSYMLSKHDN